MFPGDRVTLLERHWAKEGDRKKISTEKKKLVPREGGYEEEAVMGAGNHLESL